MQVDRKLVPRSVICGLARRVLSISLAFGSLLTNRTVGPIKRGIMFWYMLSFINDRTTCRTASFTISITSSAKHKWVESFVKVTADSAQHQWNVLPGWGWTWQWCHVCEVCAWESSCLLHCWHCSGPQRPSYCPERASAAPSSGSASEESPAEPHSSVNIWRTSCRTSKTEVKSQSDAH